MIAYITTQGAKIVREGQRLIVQSPDTRHTLFINNLEQLLLFGNVSLTPPAMFLLMREQVETTFFRLDGRYMGRLVTTDAAHVHLRKKQFLLTDNAAFCLSTAIRIVQAKILNQATVLARIKRSRQKEAAGQAARELRFHAENALRCQTIDALRGVEGAAAALYFRHLPLGLHEDWGFVRRVRRPPTDPVNAVLSLLYTLLINRCYAAVRQVGLDPQAGVLHSLAYGRNALPLDLVEEFRAPLADTLTLALFNMRMLDWGDFHSPTPVVEDDDALLTTDPQETVMRNVLRDPLGAMAETDMPESLSDLPGEQLPRDAVLSTPGQRPVLLVTVALKKVLTAFARKMETTFMHPVANRQMTYNEAVVFQARVYRKFLEDESEAYVPLLLR